MDRREFIKTSTAITLGLLNLKIPRWLEDQSKTLSDKILAVVKNGSPSAMVRQAIDLLGGISKFIKRGDVVVVKPNMGWARRPEQAANTNPEVVAEIVRLCLNAGAAKVKVFDNTCNEAKRCYYLSGIQKAAKEAGADVSYVYKQKFRNIKIPRGKILKSWEFYADALNADVFINVPIAKHHSLAKLTMGLKNIMGVIGGTRGKIHNHFDQKLADLNTIIQPQLIILDAVRILMRNGPQGGNLNDVKVMNTIIAGTDPVSVDVIGASLFGIEGKKLGYIQQAYNLGLGEIDLKKLKIERVNLAA